MDPFKGKLKKKFDKLVKYVRQNRPERLREYSKKHKLEKLLKEFVGGDGKNLLHVCCGYADSGSLFRYLIKHGVDPVGRDYQGNLPVHCALQQAINSDDPVKAWSVYTELIKPLADAYPHTLKESNNNGSAVDDLITKFLHKEDFSTSSSDTSSQFSEYSEEEEDDDYDDDSEKWNEKLAEEACNEYSGCWGKYEQDFVYVASESETYDQWADRIWSERKRKRDSNVFARWKESLQRNWLFGRKMSDSKCHRTNYESPSGHSRDFSYTEERTGSSSRSHHHHHHHQSSETPSSMSPNVKRHSPKVADFLLSNKKYDALLKNPRETPLSYNNIPWPRDASGAVITGEVLERMNIGENKMLLRKLQRRWHPDKFTQHFGDRLLKSDRDRILDQVNDIAKAFNSMARKIQ